MIYCLNHHQREADFHCGRCEQGFCRECATAKVFGSTRIESCPLCQGHLSSLAFFKHIPPFISRLPEFFIFPLRDKQWVIFPAWALFSAFFLGTTYLVFDTSGGLALLFALMSLPIYLSVLASFFYQIVRCTERGRFFVVPEWKELESDPVKDFILPTYHFLLAIAAGFTPLGFSYILLVMFTPADTFVHILDHPVIIFFEAALVMLGIFFIPMGLLAISVFQTPKALSPLFLWRQIRNIQREYAAAAGIILVIVAGFVAANLAWAAALKVLLAGQGSLLELAGFIGMAMIFGMILLYFVMVIGELLGYMAYQCRFKLKWWPETDKTALFMVAGKPVNLVQEFSLAGRKPAGPGASQALQPPSPKKTGAVAAQPEAAWRSVSEDESAAVPSPSGTPDSMPAKKSEVPVSVAGALHLLETGAVEPARTMLRTLIYVNPRDEPALRAMVRLALKTGDRELANEYGRRAGTELGKGQMLDALWGLHVEVERICPNFSYLPREQFALSNWLVKQKLFMEAARAFRELGLQFPEHELAAPALLQCGELLRIHCGKPDTAKQVYEYLLQHYPDRPEYKPAERGLLALQPQAKEYVELSEEDEETPG